MGVTRILSTDSKGIIEILEKINSEHKELNQQLTAISKYSLENKNQTIALVTKIKTISVQPAKMVMNTIETCKAAIATFDETKKAELNQIKINSIKLMTSLQALKAVCPIIDKETKVAQSIGATELDKRLSDVLIEAKQKSSRDLSIAANEFIDEVITVTEKYQKAIDIGFATHATFMTQAPSSIDEQRRIVVEAIKQIKKAREQEQAAREQAERAVREQADRAAREQQAAREQAAQRAAVAAHPVAAPSIRVF